jgi:DNA processing protein
VMAVPGPIGQPTSEGANRLIRDGARPVLEVADVLEELGLELGTPLDSAQRAASRQPADPAARRVLAELRRDPGTRDDLAARLGVAPPALAEVLLELEMDGWLRNDRDGRLIADPHPPAPSDSSDANAAPGGSGRAGGTPDESEP